MLISYVGKEELASESVIAKFATTASDGKTYQVGYYNIDVVLSVGYRVKSNRGIQFRRWANLVMKEYLQRGHGECPLFLVGKCSFNTTSAEFATLLA